MRAFLLRGMYSNFGAGCIVQLEETSFTNRQADAYQHR